MFFERKIMCCDRRRYETPDEAPCVLGFSLGYSFVVVTDEYPFGLTQKEKKKEGEKDVKEKETDEGCKTNQQR